MVPIENKKQAKQVHTFGAMQVFFSFIWPANAKFFPHVKIPVNQTSALKIQLM